MRKTIIALTLASAALVPCFADAGVLDAVKSVTGTSSASSSGGDVIGAQDALVKDYVTANKHVLMAQYKMALALGIKDAAGLAKAQAEALTSGATKDSLSKADSVQSDVAKAITERQQDASTKLDAKSKKLYSEGMESMGKGMLVYAGMSTHFEHFRSGLATASPMDLPKLDAGSYIVSTFPTASKTLASTLSQSVEFAKSNSIPVPKDATKAL